MVIFYILSEFLIIYITEIYNELRGSGAEVLSLVELAYLFIDSDIFFRVFLLLFKEIFHTNFFK